MKFINKIKNEYYNCKLNKAYSDFLDEKNIIFDKVEKAWDKGLFILIDDNLSILYKIKYKVSVNPLVSDKKFKILNKIEEFIIMLSNSEIAREDWENLSK